MGKENDFLKHLQDERVQLISGRQASVFLALTQVGLLGIILFRRYGLGQTNAEVADLNILLGFSIFGYILLRLFTYAGPPVPKFRTILIVYLGMVIGLGAILMLIYGVPAWSEWQNTYLPVVLGPAIMVGVYWLFAWIGQRRIDKELEE